MRSKDVPLPGFLRDAPLGYRATVVCETTGVSYRQLDYWTGDGLASPTVKSADGPGSARLYSADDVVAVAVVKALLDAGVSLNVAGGLVAYASARAGGLAGTGKAYAAAGSRYSVDDPPDPRPEAVCAVDVALVRARVERALFGRPAERSY